MGTTRAHSVAHVFRDTPFLSSRYRATNYRLEDWCFYFTFKKADIMENELDILI